MHQMQKARAQVLKSFTLKFQQSNKCLWGNKRGRTRKNSTNESQDLDPKGSPHKEEKLIGGVVDLDLLSCFSKYGQESLEGLRGIKALEVNNGGERGEKQPPSDYRTIGEEGPLKGAPKIEPLEGEKWLPR